MQEKCCTVGSETGQLKKVLLHRPGGEIARLTPENRSNLLFDDILWPENAQAEHDAFAALLKQNGAEVVYFADCLAHILQNKDVRSSLLDEAIALEPLDAAQFHRLQLDLKHLDHGPVGAGTEEVARRRTAARSGTRFGESTRDGLANLLDRREAQ